MSMPHQLMSQESLYRRKSAERDEFVPQAVKPEEQTETDQMDSFVLKPLYTRREIERFRRKNEKDGVFCVTEDTVQNVEDLEKLFFVWQEATETAESSQEIELGDEQENSFGFRYSALKIRNAD